MKISKTKSKLGKSLFKKLQHLRSVALFNGYKNTADMTKKLNNVEILNLMKIQKSYLK